jgi:hypothetical protein
MAATYAVGNRCVFQMRCDSASTSYPPIGFKCELLHAKLMMYVKAACCAAASKYSNAAAHNHQEHKQAGDAEHNQCTVTNATCHYLDVCACRFCATVPTWGS